MLTTRAAALAWVGVVSAVLALGAGWFAADFVVDHWNRGNPSRLATGSVLERDLLAFGVAVPAYAATAASGTMLGLNRLGARERWEAVTTLASLSVPTVVGLSAAFG